MKRLLSLAAFGAITLGFAACHNADVDGQAAVVTAHQATIDSMKMEFARQRIIDSMQTVAKATQEIQPAPEANVIVVPEKTTKKASVATSRRSASRRSGTDRSDAEYSRSTSYSNAAYDPTPVYEPAPAPAKRGWSAKAKGAVIGAGAGAVGGAIINGRNRGVGAIIGGLGGAAVGTGVGAIIDRKKGR